METHLSQCGDDCRCKRWFRPQGIQVPIRKVLDKQLGTQRVPHLSLHVGIHYEEGKRFGVREGHCHAGRKRSGDRE